MLGVLFAGAETLPAQAPNVLTPDATAKILKAVLQAHYGPGSAPTDVTGVGRLTQGSQPAQTFRFFIKGTQQMRYEFGDGTSPSISIFKSGQGSRGLQSQMRAIEDHASEAHASLLPFLDLLSEAGNPALEASYEGLKSLAGAPVYHFALSLRDKSASIRLLRRPLDEQADFYVDARTLLVVRSVHYRYAENNLELRVPSVLDFSDYRSVNGVHVPFRIVNTVGSSYLGLTQSVLVLQSVAFNQGIPESLFDSH